MCALLRKFRSKSITCGFTLTFIVKEITATNYAINNVAPAECLTFVAKRKQEMEKVGSATQPYPADDYYYHSQEEVSVQDSVFFSAEERDTGRDLHVRICGSRRPLGYHSPQPAWYRSSPCCGGSISNQTRAGHISAFTWVFGSSSPRSPPLSVSPTP